MLRANSRLCLDPEKASKDPYADYLKLTENDILEAKPKKKKRARKKKDNTENFFENCNHL